MVLDCRLAAARYDDDVLHTGMQDCFHAVLNDRPVDYRQHLLRLGLGGRQEARAEPGGREDCFADFRGHLLHLDTEAQRRRGNKEILCVSVSPRQNAVYSYRSASTGSSRAALFAGQMPKKRPTPTDTMIPVTAAHAGTAPGIDVNTVRLMSAIAQPNTIPAIPPRPVSADASNRNCVRISLFRAPTALRSPIS